MSKIFIPIPTSPLIDSLEISQQSKASFFAPRMTESEDTAICVMQISKILFWSGNKDIVLEDYSSVDFVYQMTSRIITAIRESDFFDIKA